jgi:hypothetical protein
LLFAEVMTFGLIYGRSTKGKSVALNAGGPVIGVGLEENLLTLNATAAGILEVAGTWTDRLLPINEGGTIRGKRSKSYASLRSRSTQARIPFDTASGATSAIRSV